MIVQSWLQAELTECTASTGAPTMAPPSRTAPSPAPQDPAMANGKPSAPYTVLPERPSTASTLTPSIKDPKLSSQMSSTDMKNIVRRKLTGYVGFANLPNQWHRRSVRKGFSFNVMVVGMFRVLFKKT